VKRELLPRQQLFINEYVKELDGPRAIKVAGYKAKNLQAASEDLLANPVVSGRIEEILSKRQSRSEITRDLVLSGLLNEAENSENGNTRVRAWELLGRSIQMFTEAQLHSADTRFTINLNGNTSVKYLESETLNALSIETEE